MAANDDTSTSAVFQFEKCSHLHYLDHGLSCAYFRLKVLSGGSLGPDYMTQIESELDKCLNDAVAVHTERLGRPATTISFKLMTPGTLDVVSIPAIPISEMNSSLILSCIGMSEDFITFMLSFEFYFMFRITSVG